MADQSIRKEFIDGVMEVYTTLLNNGSEETDGVFYYALSDKTQGSVYGESKYKTYKPPVLLVCKAVLTPTQGENDTEGVKDSAEFSVPIKSLTDSGLTVTQEDLDAMRRGIMKFHDVWYLIDNVSPTVYVEDVFLVYKFSCTELKVFDEDSIIIEEPEPEEDPETPPEPEDPDLGPDQDIDWD